MTVTLFWAQNLVSDGLWSDKAVCGLCSPYLLFDTMSSSAVLLWILICIHLCYTFVPHICATHFHRCCCMSFPQKWQLCGDNFSLYNWHDTVLYSWDVYSCFVMAARKCPSSFYTMVPKLYNMDPKGSATNSQWICGYSFL
jgi:hypothetical protein